MRPGSEVNPGALLTKKLGPVDPDTTDGPPPPDCCDIDPDNVPDRAEFENGGTVFRLSQPTDVDLVQFDGVGNSIAFANITATLPSDPTPGLLLVAVLVERTSGNAPDPSGWDLVGRATKVGFGGSVTTMWWRIAQSGDPAALTVTKAGSNQASLVLMEYSGAGALVDWDNTDTTADANNASVGPADVDEADSLAVAAFTQIGVPVTLTPGAGFTMVDDGATDGTDPSWIVEWGIADPATVSTTTTSSFGGGAWSALLATFAHEGSAGWTIPATVVIDGDDATGVIIDGGDTAGEFLRFDLGAAYRIQRLRYVLGMTNAGSATITLDGWNETDQSDRVTVRSTTFTGTGGLTIQTVTDEWYTADSFRYWQIDGPAEAIDWRTASLFEGTADITVQHPADFITYDNTDSGLSGDTVQEALDELAAALGGTTDFPRPLMAEDAGNPGYWYVVVDGDGNAIMITA